MTEVHQVATRGITVSATLDGLWTHRDYSSLKV